MDCFLNKMKKNAYECPFDEQDIQRCPFLRNISKSTNLSFSTMNTPDPVPPCKFITLDQKIIMSSPPGPPLQVAGSKGPIFEDGPNFDLAFNLFHGKNGVVPLTRRPSVQGDDHSESKPAPMFNPLAGKAATISLSSLGHGGPFGFNFFSDKWKKQKQKSESAGRRDNLSQDGNPSGHESLSNEWLQTGNCPIAKSYRAVGHVLPLVAKALQPPSGVELRCPPAVIAARAALARTAFVRNLRPQPLPAKMLCITALGLAANIPLGIWRAHTDKFSLSWFIAVHAAVPFIAMLRKAVVMPKTAMALTIGASILGQIIGSRAERVRLQTLKAVTEKQIATVELADDHHFAGHRSNHVEGIPKFHCGSQQMMLQTLPSKCDKPSSSGASVCFLK